MRIQTRMMVFVTVLVSVVIGVMALVMAVGRRQMVLQNFRQQADAMLDGVGRIARESLRSRDDVMLLSYLKHLMKDHPDFELAIVTKPGYSSVLGEVRTPLYYRSLEVSVDDVPGGKPSKVQIQVGFSKGGLDARIRQETLYVIRRVGAIALASLALALLGAWSVSRALAGPIVTLAARIGAMSAKGPDAPEQAVGDEIAYLASQFDDMSSRIQQDMQLKDDLLTTLTHELNNPLSGLKGLLGLLNGNRLVDRETAETYKTMTDAVTAMELSLSNALHLLKSHAKPELRRERLYLNEMLGQATRLFRPVAQAGRVRLQERFSPSAVYLDGDAELVRRIIINLISNACKYTPEGGCVTVTLEDKKDSVVISVSDTGPGIAAKDRELIFTRFYRVAAADGKAQRIPGSGLGLAIARQAAELHRARLWVESELGKGSVFTVSFPKEAAA